MLDNKRTTPFIALLGAAALMMSAPAFAQDAAPAAPAADAAAAPAAAPAAEAPAAAPAEEPKAPAELENRNDISVTSMFVDAPPIPKAIMILLMLSSVYSWTLFVMKILEFKSLNKASDGFMEAFRGAKSITEVNRISLSEEFEGNPLADMAAAATQEVELSRQAGLAVSGEHRDTTLARVHAAVAVVQSSLAKRLSGGMSGLASIGALAPFVGLLGTVWGIMTSFIGIVKTNTTNLTAVAPGIAEALLATALGLAAAIPAVLVYNLFARWGAGYRTRLADTAAAVERLVSRDIDHRRLGAPPLSRAAE
jgi:biopolymer transport protein ExbB